MRRKGLTLGTEAFVGRVDGQPVPLEVGSSGLRVGAVEFAWVDLDHFDVEDHQLHVATHDGRSATVTHLATGRDRFIADAVAARARARRAALLQWTGDAALATFEGRRGDAIQDEDEDDRVTVCLFPDGVTVEPVNGTPDLLPLSCLTEVDRDGYAIRLVARGMPDIAVRHLGQRTDEFLMRLDQTRRVLAARTDAACTALDPSLAGLGLDDGWAVPASVAGHRWGALRSALMGQRRGEEIGVLEALAGDGMRLGVKCGPGSTTMPFALVPVGDRVAVEAADADDRATFVFATPDVDRLNGVLLATSFRREALSLEPDQLGRWSLAVRTLDIVRWARAALIGRVVHNDQWATDVKRLLQE